MNNTVYTIGHSTHTIEEFVRILKTNEINCICDVRSSPFSKFVPQFNRDVLKENLKKNKIEYLEFGKEFGARRTNPGLIENGIVSFEKVAKDETFISGVNRMLNGLNKGYKMALMCSEKDPVECHRNVLVSRNLAKLGIEIIHILSDGTIQTNAELEEAMISKYIKPADRKEINERKQYPRTLLDDNIEPQISNIVESKISLIELAYERANERIGYRKDEEEE
ncbi:MAG: hypothetical protein FD133_363 [Erysipelotrichaceae bacterium]|nr:MAG: hypothetical protein FD133_363 [Erysipelotrichaceae bacterium]